MANRKKVLFLITKPNPGGAQRYVRDLATQLPQEDFEAVVATGPADIPENDWLTQEINLAKLRIVTIPQLKRDIQNPFTELGVFVAIWSLVLRERPDILHVNSAKAGGIGVFIGRILGIKKVIFTSHGWTSNEKRPFWAKKIISVFEWLTIMLSHTTIMNSRATAEHVAHFPFVTKKSMIINLGIEPFETFSKEGARTNLDISLDGTTLGTIAELHTNKGVDVFIEAFSNLPPTFQSVVIGGGDSRKNIETLIKKHSLNERVLLAGPIPNAKKYLRAFDIFVLSSRTESFGYVLLEAGMAGVPVIATRVGGIPEIIEHEKTGLLVPPENPEALASAITRLHNDPDLQKKLSDNLYTKITEQFSIEQMVEKTMTVYTT